MACYLRSPNQLIDFKVTKSGDFYHKLREAKYNIVWSDAYDVYSNYPISNGD